MYKDLEQKASILGSCAITHGSHRPQMSVKNQQFEIQLQLAIVQTLNNIRQPGARIWNNVHSTNIDYFYHCTNYFLDSANLEYREMPPNPMESDFSSHKLNHRARCLGENWVSTGHYRLRASSLSLKALSNNCPHGAHTALGTVSNRKVF